MNPSRVHTPPFRFDLLKQILVITKVLLLVTTEKALYEQGLAWIENVKIVERPSVLTIYMELCAKKKNSSV